MVTGVIEDVEENKYSVNVKVRFDEPLQWSDDWYTEEWSWGRKMDEFGTLHHLRLLPGRKHVKEWLKKNVPVN